MMKMNESIICANDSDVFYSDFNVICRLCLAKAANNQTLLREITPKDFDLLKRVADLQEHKISEDDRLPRSICTKCVKNINFIQNFISQCEQSAHILTSILIKTRACKEDDDITIKLHEVKGEQADNEQHNNPSDAQNTNSLENISAQCKNCNLCFENKIYLTAHYKSVRICRPQQLKKYKCEYCSKECCSLRDKLEHQNVHTGQTPYKCSHCSKEFKFKANLKKHIYRHQVELGLAENKLAYKEKRVRLKLKCHKCEKVFSSRSGFQYHKLKHDGKVLPKKPNTLKHKKFLCNYCAKSFYMKSNLDAHLRTHTGENPFKCEYCPKEFRQQSALTRHSLNHIDQRMLFACKVCYKEFTTKAHRDIHLRIHTGEKPYQCDFCQKNFSYKTQWRIHVRHHTGETPYVCPICTKAYCDKGSLRKHQKKKFHLPIENDSIESEKRSVKNLDEAI